MDNLLNAAARGYSKPFKKKGQHLEMIINESKDTILHVNIKSRTPSNEFVEKIVKICPQLLLQVNDKGNIPLHVAARSGESEIVEVLLESAKNQPQDIDSGERVVTTMLKKKNSEEKTAFDVAMEYKKTDVVKILIKEADSDFFVYSNIIGKVLNLAAESGDEEILDAITGDPKGKSAFLEELSKYDNPGTQSKDTILHIHIKSSRPSSTEFVKKILELRSSLLLKVNAERDTPLHFAAKYDKFDIAKILLEFARVDNSVQDLESGETAITKMMKMKNSGGKTAFDVAVESENNIQVLTILIQEADPDFFDFANNIGKILHLAAESGDHEILDAISKGEKGKRVLLEELRPYDNPGTERKDTILHININSSEPSTEFVKYILDLDHLCPSLLQQVNANNDTPVHVAAKCDEHAIMEVLLKSLKDYQPQDQESTGERTITEILKMENSDGKKAFDVSVDYEKLEVLKILINEAEPDCFDFANDIGKILNLAAENGDYEILDAIAKGSKGKSTLLSALKRNDITGTESKDTILHIHIKSFYWAESAEFVEKVLELCPQLLLKPNADGDTPLHIAAKRDKCATTEVLLKEGDIKETLKRTNRKQKTAFDVAVEYGNIQVLKILIKEAETDFFDFAKHIGKILNLAAESGDEEILDAIAGGHEGETTLREALRKHDITGTLSKDTILHININSAYSSDHFVKKVLDIYPPLLLQADDNGDTPLHAAAKWGEFECDRMQVLLKHARDQPQEPLKVERPDRKFAVKCGQSAILEVLLKGARDQTQEERPDWKIWKMKNKDGKTALDMAIEDDEIKVVELLIREAGPDFLDFSDNFNKILYFAAKRGNHEMVDEVAKSPSRLTALDVAVVNSNISIEKQSADTILHVHIKSLKNPSKEFMKEILDKCPSLLVKVNEKGDTPLHVAAKCGHYALAEFLLERARKKPQDLESGLSANWQMLEKTNIEGNKANWQMLRLTDENGINRADWQMLRMTNSEGNTALHEAVRHGKTIVVEILTKEPDSSFSYFANHASETPLYLAAGRGYYRMVCAILGGSKSAAHNGPNGMTALHAAVMNSNIPGSKSATNESPYEMTDFVDSDSDEEDSEESDSDDSGYDIDDSDDLQSFESIMEEIYKKKKILTKAKDKHGWTPLHYAAYHGLKDKVSILLKYDESAAYITDKDRKMTALHMAASQGHKDIIEKIISKCVECCEMEDEKGWNVLHFAMLSLSKEDLTDLIKNPFVESLINKKDANGNTPLHIRAAAYQDSFFHVGDTQAVNTKKISVEHMLKNGNHELEEEIHSLFEDKGHGQYQKGVIREKKDNEYFKSRGERRKKYYDGLKQTKEYHLLVATLIATVTFTAAFTIPGGYNSEKGSDEGTAILHRNLAFRTFIITDTIAMTLSLFAVFVHFIMSFQKFQRHDESLLTLALWLTILAMGAVVVAFVTGVYAVLEPSLWLAITICSLGLSFFLLILCTLILLYAKLFKRQGGSAHVLPIHSKKGN